MTVVHGGRRLDLTLPTDIPVATFIGELAWTCGVKLDTERPPPLYLNRPVSGALSPSRTLAQSGIVDGDLLILDERRVDAPRVVDDLGRAVTETVERHPGRWERPATVNALCLAAALVAGGGALVLAFGWEAAGRPGPLLPALATAVLLGVAALARAAPTPVLLALLLAAVPWGGLAAAAATGSLGGGPTGATALTFAGTGAVVVALAGAAARRREGPPLLAVAVGAAAVAGSAALVGASGLGGEQAGSVVTVAALVGLLLVPRLVVRASGLPDLGDGAPGEEVAARVAGSRRLLAWLVGGLSAAFVISAAMLVAAPGPAGRALAVLVATAFAMRARTFRFVAEAAAPFAAAGLTVAAVAGAATLAAGPLVTAVAAVGIALALAGAAATDWVTDELRPATGKAVELFELAVLLAIMPVAVVSSGLLAAIRTLAGGLVGS